MTPFAWCAVAVFFAGCAAFSVALWIGRDR